MKSVQSSTPKTFQEFEGNKMKNIFSFKVNPNIFHVKNMIRFYQSCEKLGETIYVSGKNQLEQIHKLPQFLSFLLVSFSKDDDCLIVIEGEHTNQLKKLMGSMMPQMNTRPGLA
ncbi:MAG: hypothetical protein ACE3JK_08770 [Sporolactobacillus sp.]